MNTIFYSTLLLLTSAAALAFGVAAGYWVICAFLNFFDPSRNAKAPAAEPALVSSGAGD